MNCQKCGYPITTQSYRPKKAYYRRVIRIACECQCYSVRIESIIDYERCSSRQTMSLLFDGRKVEPLVRAQKITKTLDLSLCDVSVSRHNNLFKQSQ